MLASASPDNPHSAGNSLGTGLYLLADRSSAALDSRDLRALGLTQSDAKLANAISAKAVDAEKIGAASTAAERRSWCCFLGEIEDSEVMAVALKCGPTPAAIAMAAVQKWGAETATLLKGEWALLYRDGKEGALWLGVSRALRDRIYFAHKQSRIAVSGDLLRLCAVSWIDAHHDPCGVVYAIGTSAIRAQRAGRTVYKDIFEVEPGAFHRFDDDGSHTIITPADKIPVPFQDSFDNAVGAIEQRLQKVVGSQLSNHRRVAIQLSGGLDSAIIARFVAEMRLPGQEIIALTSAVPPQSSLPDERELAGAVASAFGMEHRLAWPSEDARIFQPAPDHFADGRLNLSPRHYTDRALLNAAREFGATAIFDGVGGEISVSASRAVPTFLNRLRHFKRWIGGASLRHRDGRQGTGQFDSYLARPSRKLLASLPDDFHADALSALPHLWSMRGDGTLGLMPGHDKAWRTPTSATGGGIRQYSPLRDRELILTVAGMPTTYSRWQGRDRALARALLDGHVPEHVSGQEKGLGYSVDYDQRFRTELPEILARIGAWRQAGVDDWLDIDWLENEVRRLSALESVPSDAQFPVHLTAIASEYFLYCHASGGR